MSTEFQPLKDWNLSAKQYAWFSHISIYLSIYLSIYTHISTHLSIYLYTCMQVCHVINTQTIINKWKLLKCMHAKSLQLCQILCNPIDWSLPSSSVHGDSPGKNTGVGCHALLQGIFLTQESNPWVLYLLYLQVGSLPLAPPEKPIYTNCMTYFKIKDFEIGHEIFI